MGPLLWPKATKLIKMVMLTSKEQLKQNTYFKNTPWNLMVSNFAFLHFLLGDFLVAKGHKVFINCQFDPPGVSLEHNVFYKDHPSILMMNNFYPNFWFKRNVYQQVHQPTCPKGP